MTFSTLSPIAKRPWIMLSAFAFAMLQPAWANDPVRGKGASGAYGGTQSGSVSGRVVDDRTGVFLADATVSLLWRPGQSRGAVRSDREIPQATKFSVLSRGDGSFEFDRIPTGNYAVAAELPGYLKSGMGASPRVVKVLPGNRNSGLVVKLHPESAIQGQVLDGEGRGAAGAEVRAFAAFRGRLREIASGIAGESGEFTIGRLPHGRYILFAEPPALSNVQAPAYYPSSPTVDGSAPVDVGLGGRVSGIRIVLLRGSVHRVRGNVDDFRNILGNRDASVYLVPRSDRGMDLTALARKTPLDANRSFEFSGVPSGLYTVQLVRERPDPRLLATQVVSIGSVDVTGLNLCPEPTVSLRGQATVAGHADRDLSAVRVVFLAVPSAAGFAASVDALAGRDGRFSAQNLEPASYVISVQTPPDMYVQRVMFGGREVEGRALDLAGGIWGSLNIALRDGAARIAGAVLEAESSAERAERMPVAILYPAGSDPGTRGRRVASAAGSRFEFEGLAPGRYKVFATDRFDPELFAEPAFLAQVAGAVRTVDVRRFDRKRLDLRLLDAGQVEAAARRAGVAGF